MEEQVNDKLSNYFFRNQVLIGYLKIIDYYYRVRKITVLPCERFKYELLSKNINYILNKQISEENSIKEIVKSINKLVVEHQTDELNEIYHNLLEVVDLLNASIDNSDRYIEGCLTKYKMNKKGIGFISNIDYETIESERNTNHFNQRILKKEIKEQKSK